MNRLQPPQIKVKVAAKGQRPHTLCVCQQLFGPRRKKTCLRGFRQRGIQASLLSYRD